MLRHLIAILILVASCSGQAATPEDAVVRFAMAKDPNELISVLPETTRKTLLKAKPEVRQRMLREFLSWKSDDEGLQVEERIGDDLLTFRTKTKEVLHIKVNKSVNDGMSAVLALNISFESPKWEEAKARHGRVFAILVWTKFEDGGWRITGVSGGEGVEFDSEDFLEAVDDVEKTGPKASEASAVGGVRTINTANVTYAATYDQGFALSLKALASDGAKEPSREHSMLIDDVLGAGEKSGYVFKYELLSPEVYTIIARPKQYGVTGTKSFFSDESGVIRWTDQDREPKVSDEPLQ